MVKKYVNHELVVKEEASEVKKSKIDVEYFHDFQPHYVAQKTFTRFAKVHAIITSRFNIYYLIVNSIKLCKITIDKKAYTKSRLFINNSIKIDACNFKYMNDFIQQYMTLNNSSLIKKLVNHGVITKENILKYAKAL